MITRNGYTSSVDIYAEEGYAIKKFKGGDLRPCLQMEVDALQRIQAVDPICKHFPTLIDVLHDRIKITYCGEPPTKATIPVNFEEQIVEILRVLKAANVLHRDMRPGNILIHGNLIKVIDFSLATTFIKPKPKPSNAPGLGGSYRPGVDKFDDAFSLRKSIADVRSGKWPGSPQPTKKK